MNESSIKWYISVTIFAHQLHFPNLWTLNSLTLSKTKTGNTTGGWKVVWPKLSCKHKTVPLLGIYTPEFKLNHCIWPQSCQGQNAFGPGPIQDHLKRQFLTVCSFVVLRVPWLHRTCRENLYRQCQATQTSQIPPFWGTWWWLCCPVFQEPGQQISLVRVPSNHPL